MSSTHPDSRASKPALDRGAPHPEGPRRADATTIVRALIVALFFLSGSCSLIYEIVWLRMLVVVFGMSAFAVSTVLASFMAGLALGSAWFGRLVDRRGDPLRIYAWLELGIGLFALAFPLLLGRLDDLYTLLYRHLPGGVYAFQLARFLVGFCLLLVPTTLMGGTLPALSKLVVERLSGIGRRVGLLYAVNTLGAAAGCAAAAYLLIERFGTQGATYVAATGNLLISAAAFAAARRLRRARPAVAVAGRTEPTESAVAGSAPWLIRFVFWGFALSGFTALAYEVVWTRVLCMVLGITTVQSVSTLLIVFLFGLAAGGAIATRWVDRLQNPCAAFGGLEILLGLSGLGSLAVIGRIPELSRGLVLYSWWGHIVELFIVALCVMLIPTLLMGMLFPLVGRIQVLGLDGIGRRIGGVYAVNTSGAILGAFAAGFVLIPLFGSQVSLQLLAAINIALGAVVLALDGAARRSTRGRWAAALAIPPLLLIVLVPRDIVSDVFRRALPRSKLLYHSEETAGTVTVHEHANGVRLLRVNGAGEVPTDHASIQTFRLLGSLPFMLHADPEEVLVVAFGGGVTLAAAELHHPKRIDCVELVPGVVRAAPYFAEFNNRVFERFEGSGIELIADDGRNHILRTERKYDVLISDSTHPGTADSWVLYTEEFYRLCRKRLAPGGIMAQWLPLHGLTEDDFKLILRTFDRVFDHPTLWLTGQYGIMVATPERLRIDFERVEAKLADPDIHRALAEVDLGDPISFLGTFGMGERTLRDYVGDGATNTDDRPYISFGDRARVGTAGGLPVRIGLLPFLGDSLVAQLDRAGRDDRDRLRRRFFSRRHALAGGIAIKMGDRDRATVELERAREIDPDELEARRLLEYLDAGGGAD